MDSQASIQDGGFIARHGLVKYGNRRRRYPRNAVCELGICHLLRTEPADWARIRRQDIEQRLAGIRREHRQLDIRWASLKAWQPRTGRTRQQRRDRMSSCRRLRRALNTERRDLDEELGRILRVYDILIAEAAAVPDPAAVLVRDHCHAHGWIRGLICMSCNNTIAIAENQENMPASAAQAARIRSYLANCPGCR